MHNTLDVSIVLITWNVKDLLVQCLRSIYEHTCDLRFEVILVDNASVDGTKEHVRTEFPDVVLIENDTNRGVAAARNQGMELAQGTYVFILDADTKLMENSIRTLYEFMESSPMVGLTGSKLVDSQGQLQYTSRRFPTLMSILSRRLDFMPLFGHSKALDYHMMTDWNHELPGEVDYVIGACQFIRRSVMTKIGLYDDKIFYGPEDLDYCLRVWHAGYSVMYYPRTAIYHYEQRITKKKFFSKITLRHLMGLIYIFSKYRAHFDRSVGMAGKRLPLNANTDR